MGSKDKDDDCAAKGESGPQSCKQYQCGGEALLPVQSPAKSACSGCSSLARGQGLADGHRLSGGLSLAVCIPEWDRTLARLSGHPVQQRVGDSGLGQPVAPHRDFSVRMVALLAGESTVHPYDEHADSCRRRGKRSRAITTSLEGLTTAPEMMRALRIRRISS